MISYFYLFLVIIFTTAGQIFYKIYFREKKILWLFIAIASFVLIPIFNYLALKDLPIDVVYMASALTIVSVLFISILFIGEKISTKQIFASLIICAGIIIYNL